MEFKDYQDYLIAIYNKNNIFQGSGICYDGKNIITCAHVVNAALGLNELSADSKIGQKIKIKFPWNTDLQNYYFEASVKQWFANNNESTQLNFKNDVATLEILCEDTSTNTLDCCRKIDFVRNNDSNGKYFKLLSYDNISQDTISVAGKFGDYIHAERKVQLLPGEINQLFIQKGCSGTPVFSEDNKGIVGIVRSLSNVNQLELKQFSTMICSERLIELVPELKLRNKGREKLKSSDKMKYKCDREDIISKIDDKLKIENNSPVTLIIGNRQQEGVDFYNRYLIEFFNDAEDNETLIFSFNLPKQFNESCFKGKFMDRLINEFEDKISKNSLYKCYGLYDVVSFITAYQTVIFILNIQADILEEGHRSVIAWINEEITKINKIPNSKNKLHSLIIFQFENENDINKKQLVEKEFKQEFENSLTNVSTFDIICWIDEIPNDSLRNSLKNELNKKDSYPMLEIINAFQRSYSKNN
jgi:hypothetical protein